MASRWQGFIRQFLWTLPAGVAVHDMLGSVVRVDGLSMQPTLNAKGTSTPEWVLVEKFTVKWRHIYRRGDVYVFWAPDNPHEQVVKRLIAKEGDTIFVPGRDKPEKIPQGRCWVEGDNRARSVDSRQGYGPIHLGLMEGRVTHVVWPPSQARRVANRRQAHRLVKVDSKGT